MSAKRFSASEAIGFGWKTVRDNLGLYIKIYIMAGFFIIAPIIITILLGHSIPLLAGIISLIRAVILFIFSIGLLKVSLRFIDKGKSGIKDFFPDISLSIKCFLALIIYELIVVIGLILLVLPGVYFAVRFIFTPYIILDKGYGPIAALNESYRITKGIF